MTNDKSSILKVILATIILGAAGLATYFIMPKKTPPITVTPTPSSVLTPEPTASLAPTPVVMSAPTVNISDWKTYRNDKYGYEIKYPKDWRIAIEYMKTIAEISKDQNYTPSENDFIVITKLSPTEEKEFLKFAKENRGIAMSPYFNFGLGKTITIVPVYGNKEDLYKEINNSITIKSSNIRDVVLSGITVTRYRRYEATDNGEFDYESALFPYNNSNNFTRFYDNKKYNYIEIRIERNNGNFEENIFNQILTTIKFDKP